jgi:hypothetical protein
LDTNTTADDGPGPRLQSERKPPWVTRGLATIRDKQFNPSADEFKELAPELVKLAEAIERRRKDPKFVVLRSGYDFDEDAGKLTPPDPRRLSPPRFGSIKSADPARMSWDFGACVRA